MITAEHVGHSFSGMSRSVGLKYFYLCLNEIALQSPIIVNCVSISESNF